MITSHDSSEISLKIIESSAPPQVQAALIELLDWEKKRLEKDRFQYKADYKKILSRHVLADETRI